MFHGECFITILVLGVVVMFWHFAMDGLEIIPPIFRVSGQPFIKTFITH